MIPRHCSTRSAFSQLSMPRNSTHLGITKFSLVMGKSDKICSITVNASSLFISLQLMGTTCLPYCSSMRLTRSCVSWESGLAVFNRIIKGLSASLQARTVFSSAPLKLSAGISPKEPSVVITIPMLECSCITLFVPMAAASENGISLSDQGVFTRRSLSSSTWPAASGTR